MAEKPRDDVQLPGVDDEQPVSPPATDQVNAAIDTVIGQLQEPPKIVFPRALRRGQAPPERLLTIKNAPEPYSEIQVTMWVNPSSALVQAVAEKRNMLRDFLFFFVRDWNLELESETEGGQPEKAEVTPENFALLTEEYLGWLGEKFREARTNPLPLKPVDTSVAIQESRLTGGSTKGMRNGSG